VSAVHVTADVASFAVACADLVVAAAREAIAARGRFVLGLTGGSTPEPVHRALADAAFADAIEWRRVVIVFGDERAVPIDDRRSNFRAARESLLRHVPVPDASVLRMRGEAADLDAEARRYAEAFEREAGGQVDLLFVGLGKDAHILSLFPGSPAIAERARLVVAELDPPMDPAVSRLTFTPALFARTRRVVAIATGAGKAEAVRRALEGDEPPLACPAALLCDTDPARATGATGAAGEVTWLLDRSAAASLRIVPTA
jgi:6-phosphogluconolactonase